MCVCVCLIKNVFTVYLTVNCDPLPSLSLFDFKPLNQRKQELVVRRLWQAFGWSKMYWRLIRLDRTHPISAIPQARAWLFCFHFQYPFVCSAIVFAISCFFWRLHATGLHGFVAGRSSTNNPLEHHEKTYIESVCVFTSRCAHVSVQPDEMKNFGLEQLGLSVVAVASNTRVAFPTDLNELKWRPDRQQIRLEDQIGFSGRQIILHFTSASSNMFGITPLSAATATEVSQVIRCSKWWLPDDD